MTLRLATDVAQASIAIAFAVAMCPLARRNGGMGRVVAPIQAALCVVPLVFYPLSPPLAVNMWAGFASVGVALWHVAAVRLVGRE